MTATVSAQVGGNVQGENKLDHNGTLLEHMNSNRSISGNEEYQTCNNWAELVAYILSYEDDKLKGEIFSLNL
eukprot:3989070-Ditylum_brightwellii.AAC.1